MAFYIKEWADRSATLITRKGHHLFTFKNVDCALTACGKWYGVSANHVIPHRHPETGGRPALRLALRQHKQTAV